MVLSKQLYKMVSFIKLFFIRTESTLTQGVSHSSLEEVQLDYVFHALVWKI